MRKAEDEYQDVGTICKHLRKFSENAPVFNSWLTLLPRPLIPPPYTAASRSCLTRRGSCTTCARRCSRYSARSRTGLQRPRSTPSSTGLHRRRRRGVRSCMLGFWMFLSTCWDGLRRSRGVCLPLSFLPRSCSGGDSL